ncbi:unnamed protein product, partial [Ectocarpus sp. 12 AP-2014]
SGRLYRGVQGSRRVHPGPAARGKPERNPTVARRVLILASAARRHREAVHRQRHRIRQRNHAPRGGLPAHRTNISGSFPGGPTLCHRFSSEYRPSRCGRFVRRGDAIHHVDRLADGCEVHGQPRWGHRLIRKQR